MSSFEDAVQAADAAFLKAGGDASGKAVTAAVTAAWPHLIAPFAALADALESQETEAEDPDVEAAYASADRDAARRIRELIDDIEQAANQ